jgi:multidrug efflux pump subunit AcrA (membrane-fusion protein)
VPEVNRIYLAKARAIRFEQLMFRRRNIILNSILIIALGAIGFFGWRTLYPKAAAATVRTATVSLQNVSTSVSATGSVQTSSDLGLNFGTSGIVRTIKVKVGDQVRKGEFLAGVDDRATNLALLQAQASEKSAEVSVANAGVGVQNARIAVSQGAQNSQTTLANDDQAIVNAQIAVAQGAQNSQTTLANDDQAIVNAQNALAKLQAGPTSATLAQQAQQIVVQNQSIAVAQAALASAQTAYSQVQQSIATNLTSYNNAVDNAQYDYSLKCNVLPTGTDCTIAVSSRPTYLILQSAQQAKTAGVLKDSQSLANAQTAVDNATRGLLSANQALDTLKAQQAVANQPATQVDIDAANAAIATAQRAKETAVILAGQQATLAAASLASAQRAKETAVILSGQQAKQTAGSLITAQGSLTNAKESLLLSKASLANAQTNMSNTRLVSPVSATVAAIANAVGVNAGSTTAGSSGATGFIVLTQLSGLQVKASFAEADVVSLQVGQAATFTFDAIANSTATGTLLSIAPLSNASTGSVTSYNVTFSLDSAPTEVKPGMTAQVSVVTAQAQGVLAVTSTALTQRGTTYFVTMKPTKVGVAGVRTPVTVGLKGDSATEITSGLKAGDQVVLRTTTSSSASANNNGFPSGGVPGAGIGAAVRGNG